MSGILLNGLNAMDNVGFGMWELVTSTIAAWRAPRKQETMESDVEDSVCQMAEDWSRRRQPESASMDVTQPCASNVPRSLGQPVVKDGVTM